MSGDVNPPTGPHDIAVIGMACRFPGADDPEAFLENLCAGRSAISPLPGDRWPIDAYYDSDPRAPGKIYTSHGGTISDIDLFDRNLFGISANEARMMDPQQRILLEVTWHALERAGIAPPTLAGSRTGVFVGIGSVDYWLIQARAGFPAATSPYAPTGGSPSAAAGRIAYCLGLNGPAISVDTACSSALTSLALACDALLRGDCPIAIAGAANVILSPDVMASLCRMGALSPDGQTKAFDARADGYVRGEGAGVVVLKPLPTALQDNDAVIAVIKGWAVNQDGRTNGLTAPSRAAQREVIEAALCHAGVDADCVAYVEAHGTGTALGDLVEMNALADVFGRRTSGVPPLLVGSVKAAVGHLEAAAGMAGLQKAILMLGAGKVPGQLSFWQPSPKISWDEIPIDVPTTARTWPHPMRVAGVSAFGFSGTNAHVIVAQGTEARPKTRRNGTLSDRREGPPVLIAFSAATPAALARRANDLSAYLEAHPEIALDSVAGAAARSFGHLSRRDAAVAAHHDEAIEGLRAIARRWEEGPDRRVNRARRVVVRISSTRAWRFTRSAFASAFPGIGAHKHSSDGDQTEEEDALFWRATGLEIAAIEQVAPGDAPTTDGTKDKLVITIGDRLTLDAAGESNDPDQSISIVLSQCDPVRAILQTLAAAYRLGADFDACGLFTEGGLDLNLPSYPFDRERFWFDDV